MRRNPINIDVRPVDLRVVPAPSQIMRLEPVVATVYGGGTSAVVMRGDYAASASGVRVSVDEVSTTSPPTV
jgi:hypothetical protein